jgi:hypothetical protein
MQLDKSQEYIHDLFNSEVEKKYKSCKKCNSINLTYASTHVPVKKCNEHKIFNSDCMHCLYYKYNLCLSCIMWDNYDFCLGNDERNEGCHFYVFCNDCRTMQQPYPKKPAYLDETSVFPIHTMRNCEICNNVVCMQCVLCSGCNTFRPVCVEGEIRCCKEFCRYACYQCAKD